MDYGYCRISTKKQHIERQIRNILEYSPKAVIVQEVFTGTKFQERKELNRLLRLVVKNDRIIFDSVSRMARNADEGCQLYEHLYNTGIELVFLNVHESFENCVTMFQQQAESKNQTLSLTEQILYPYVYMDAPHLSEVCLNIISNAIKYTNTGGTISCNVLQESCEKEDWCNCIKDAEEWTDTGNRIKENEKMKKTAIVTGEIVE